MYEITTGTKFETPSSAEAAWFAEVKDVNRIPAKMSEQFRKLFIGGLSYDTTEDSLRGYFEKWGNIVDCVVMRDGNTKRSRGFGFVTYDSVDALNEAQANRPHVIDNKEVESKRATPREEAGKPEARMSIKKVFVGGLKEEVEEDNLRDYFSNYGNVITVDVIMNKETGRKRGFAFVTFDDYDPVDKICLEKEHHISGKRCDVRKALDKKDMQNMPSGGQGGRSMGGGGRGGGRGGGMGGRSSYGGGQGGGRSNYGNNQGGGYGGGYSGGNSYNNGNNYNGGGDNWNSQGGSGGNWGNNQGGGSWDNNQGGGNWGNNQGGGNWGNNQGGGNWDSNQGGGNWGNNQGGGYSGGNQGGYGGGGGNYGGGSGGPMKGGNYSNRSSGKNNIAFI